MRSYLTQWLCTHIRAEYGGELPDVRFQVQEDGIGRILPATGLVQREYIAMMEEEEEHTVKGENGIIVQANSIFGWDESRSPGGGGRVHHSGSGWRTCQKTGEQYEELLSGATANGCCDKPTMKRKQYLTEID